MKLHWIVTTVCFAMLLGACAVQTPATEASTRKMATPPTTIGQEVDAAIRDRIEVSFASGSDHLSAVANRQLDIAARLFRDVNPVMMFSVGFSDALGSEWDNLLLAARRARAVKGALVSRGIPADRVQLRSFGQSDAVTTSEPLAAPNRRVVVNWRIL